MTRRPSEKRVATKRLKVEPAGENRFELIARGASGASAFRLGVEEQFFLEKNGVWEAIQPAGTAGIQRLALPAPTLVWTRSFDAPAVLLEEQMTAEGDALVWKARFANRSASPVRLKWRQRVSGLPAAMRCFTPAATSHHGIRAQPLRVGYRELGRELAMPLVTLYQRAPDVGLSFASHFEGLIEPLTAELVLKDGGGELTLERTILNLRPGEAHTITAYVVGHEGCWRPGLRWARERFRQFFYLSDPSLRETQGCFVSSCGLPAEDLVARWEQEGVKYVEIHSLYPHLGKYVPEEEPWLRMMDDRWSAIKRTTDPAAPAEDAPYETIKEYLYKVCKANMTRAKVRAYIRRCHRHGIRCFNYFQPTESWEFFADDYFFNEIHRIPDGSPSLTWYDHLLVECGPETRWGQYLQDQLEGVLAMYPELDGIFMDQASGDYYNNPIHQVKRITDVLGRMMKSRGKRCWWNGPEMIELTEHAIGMLVEWGYLSGEKMKYLTVGDKVSCGMGFLERQYQRNLINGLWPYAPSGSKQDAAVFSDTPAHYVPIDPDLERRHERYLPLFQLFQGKTWVLEARPVELPDELQGNVFQRPNGDYLVPVIDPAQSMDRPVFRWDVPVKIKVAEAARVKAVYGLTPDCPGKIKLPFKRQGTTINVALPRLRSAALLYLATTGVHVSAAGDCGRRADNKEPVRLSVDNWDRKPHQVRLAVGNKRSSLRVAPGERRQAAGPAPKAAGGQGLLELSGVVTVDGRREKLAFGWYSDQAFDLYWQGYLAAVVGEPSKATLVLVNRAARRRTVQLALSSAGVKIPDLPVPITLAPGARKACDVTLFADQAGANAMTVIAREDGREISRVTDAVHGWGSILGSCGLVPVFNGHIGFTTWALEGSQHATRWGLKTTAPLPPIPVRQAYLNGKLLGPIQTRNYRRWHPAGFVAIPPEVFPFIRKDNEVVIEPAGPDDFFKIKNVGMTVVLADGQYLQTPPAPEVYSSRPHEQAEGIVGAPLKIRLAFA